MNMLRKTVLVLGVGLLLGFGLTLSVAADDTTLERPGFALTTLDSSGNVGQYSSVAIGTDGLALISYYDASNGDLKVAHCSDLACTSATRTTLQSEDNVGLFTSVTIGTDGLGLISYYDASNGDLKVAHCSDLACTTATRTILTFLQSEGNVGQFTSVTITGGHGLISYYDSTDQVLMLALCPDLACTTPTVTNTPDRTGNVGQYSSVAIGTDGLALISYYDVTNGDLKVAHCSDVACTSATLTAVDGAANNVGAPSSMITGADGRGLISYYDATNGDLRVAHCANVACTAAALTTVDSTGSVGQYSSVTIGADGLALISYYDETNGDLKVAHCSNLLCVPYHRRR
jgi:preprotein translocase subunit Sec61beta